ncbi:MAG: MarR family transcriptional regulator [Dehalococcoidia bacterium]|nr:MarR family transcriptional regulator [Dehalococcoidia bacterium]
MTVNFESGNTVLKLWILLHRVRDMLRICEDQIFGEYGLTTEQYAVLAAMKYLGDSVRVTDLAQNLERSPNSVSMIIDRMVKIGLVKRVRDKGDRRVVRLFITSKGENALKPATPAGVEFIQKILSPLSYEDKRTLASLLEAVKFKALEYLNPGMDIAEISKNSVTNQPDLMERLTQYTLTSTPQAKRQGGDKRKIKGKTI